MAVSDQHGGGLTIQRVLGRHLDDIRTFFTVGKFALDMPAKSELRDRCVPFTFWSESSVAKRVLRCRPLAKWDQLAFGSRVRRIERQLRRQVAEDPTAYWLLCPQSEFLPFVWNGAEEPISPNYVTWIMDDHVVQYHNGALRYPAKFRAVMERHLQQAGHVFVISPAMADFYRAEFGVESTVLFCGTDQIAELSFAPPPGTTIRLAYFGALGAWQLDALSKLCEVVSSTDATLDIYSAVPLPTILKRHGVEHKGYVRPAQINAVMAGYHAVVLPISFIDELRQMTTLNIATKMSELLGSGTLLLVVGPSYSAMVDFLKPHKAAVIVESLSMNDIHQAIMFCRDGDGRAATIANARRLASSELKTEHMRRKWENALEGLDRQNSQSRPFRKTGFIS